MLLKSFDYEQATGPDGQYREVTSKYCGRLQRLYTYPHQHKECGGQYYFASLAGIEFTNDGLG